MFVFSALANNISITRLFGAIFLFLAFFAGPQNDAYAQFLPTAPKAEKSADGKSAAKTPSITDGRAGASTASAAKLEAPDSVGLAEVSSRCVWGFGISMTDAGYVRSIPTTFSAR